MQQNYLLKQYVHENRLPKSSISFSEWYRLTWNHCSLKRDRIYGWFGCIFPRKKTHQVQTKKSNWNRNNQEFMPFFVLVAKPLQNRKYTTYFMFKNEKFNPAVLKSSTAIHIFYLFLGIRDPICHRLCSSSSSDAQTQERRNFTRQIRTHFLLDVKIDERERERVCIEGKILRRWLDFYYLKDKII